MCGRFSFSANERIVEERFDIKVDTDLYKPRYNCAPSQILAVITNNKPTELSYLRWGLIPFWAKDMSIGNKLINTKAETITEKPSFKYAFSKHRCLVLTDGFYEWKKDKAKTPYHISLRSHKLFAMAGLWEQWKNDDGSLLESFTIITTEANDFMKNIHHRMPVILKIDDEKKWLFENKLPILQNLLKPYDSNEMIARQVSKKVNNPINDNELILLEDNLSL